MSGRLVVAYPHGTENPPVNFSQACYFIVMRHPSMCSALAESQMECNSTVHGRENENSNSTNNTNEVMEMDKSEGFMIITVDTVSGQLIHAGIPQKDIFPSMDEAIRGIHALCPQTTHSFDIRTLFEFLAFAGGSLSDEFIHLLFIEASTLLQDGRGGIGRGGGGGGAAPYSYSTEEKNSQMEDSTINWYIPPIYAVKKAKWCKIPLRITVPALQHSLKISEMMHSSTHNSTYTTPLYSLANLTNGSEPPYLYYSPGIDITHSSIFKDALTRCATINQTAKNVNQDNTLKNMKEKDSSNSTNINVFLPPLPKKTGRDALGRCDCLWNEELISFCEVFALGNCCCRLALGSCSSIPLLNPLHDSSIALLLVRISRLAICGCFYDYTVESTKTRFEDYVSTLETEFQFC
ncbi:hypothetical protein LSM04_007510 [Trypanosoma melophagium]|uniref:uncharacterized protein n=1 Tax=Trypanosoma melophagium TaxID=715481 RepID=UPI003519F4DE|nr:hypothetical protein LSM04_007510 [Trypanosoma melophagium]